MSYKNLHKSYNIEYYDNTCIKNINFDRSDYTISSSDQQKFKNTPSTYGYVTPDGVDTLLSEIKKYFPNTSNLTFADMGSGSGRVIFSLSNCNFKKLIGIEMSKDRHMMAINKRKEINNNSNIVFINDDMFSYNYSNVDVIYISNLCFDNNTNKNIFNKLGNELKSKSLIFTSQTVKHKQFKFMGTISVKQSWDTNGILYINQKI